MTRNIVALATIDYDFGHVPADTAKEEAETIANEEGKPVTLRDLVTDEVDALRPHGRRRPERPARNS